MSQDTRKDPRAKIVALNVRYKSATVDEFIEHHSHDVSKGGMFVKTPSPFPPGTLLKFEIRIEDDKTVIAGVGRVVWKRDDSGGGPEKPAGMGIKFIKLDDTSRGVIEKLTAEHPDAGAAYDRPVGVDVVRSSRTSLPPAAGVDRKGTVMGIGVPSSAPSALHLSSNPPPAEPATRPNNGPVIDDHRASGPPSAAKPASALSTPPETGESHMAELVGASGAPMFPKTGGEADMPPPQERTMMKHTSELLEEVLRETGGASDEPGTNPLFSGVPSTRMSFPDAPSSGSTGLKSPSSSAPASKRPEAIVPLDKPSSPEPSPVPRSVRPVTPEPISTRAPAVRAPAVVEALPPVEAEKSNVPLVLAAILAVGTVGYVIWMKQQEAAQTQPVPSAPTTAIVTSSSPNVGPPSNSGAPTLTPPVDSDSSTTAASALDASSVDASPVDARATVNPSVAPSVPPIVTPAQVGVTPPAVTAKPAPVEPKPIEPKPVAPKPPKPEVTATPEVAPKPAVTAVPKPVAPKPPPKPAEDPDNPY